MTASSLVVLGISCPLIGIFATSVSAATFQGLGDLAGGTFGSWAGGVSADGKVVVGKSKSTNGYEAFRWTPETGMVGLGDLPGGIFHSGVLFVRRRQRRDLGSFLVSILSFLAVLGEAVVLFFVPLHGPW